MTRRVAAAPTPEPGQHARRFSPTSHRETKMNWDRVQGNWKQFKGEAQRQWGKLTDDEIDQVEGDRERLAGRIQERYGIAKDEANRQIDDWLARH